MSAEPDPSAFVEVLAPALCQAASIVRGLEGRVANTPKTGETTAVKQALTVADTASQEALLAPLFRRFPDLRIEAEEDTPTAERFTGTSDALAVIDPIDGTLHHFLRGEGPYAIIAGLTLRERCRAALIALPREGLFLDAVEGQGARIARAGGGEARPARMDPNGTRVLVSSTMPDAVLEALRERDFEPVPGCGGAIAVAPLVPGVVGGLRWVPGGGQGVSIRGRIGLRIAREAGAVALGHDGKAFPETIYERAPLLAVAGSEACASLLLEAAASLDAR